jgi:hypothetical protein
MAGVLRQLKGVTHLFPSTAAQQKHAQPSRGASWVSPQYELELASPIRMGASTMRIALYYSFVSCGLDYTYIKLEPHGYRQDLKLAPGAPLQLTMQQAFKRQRTL